MCFSRLFYSVMLLEISLIILQVKLLTTSFCGGNISVSFFCANSATSGSSVILDTSSKAPTFANVSCRCDLKAPGDFYLASFLSQGINISDIITVNGKSAVAGNSSILFQNMSLIFSANTGQFGILSCIGIKAVNSSTTITATCLTNEASIENDQTPEKTTRGNIPATYDPHDSDGNSKEKTKKTDTDIIFGAAGGAIAVFVAVILAVVCFYKKRRSDQNRTQTAYIGQPKEDMTECAMYIIADDNQEESAKATAADGSKYTTEPEYTYITDGASVGFKNQQHEDGEDDSYQRSARVVRENVRHEAEYEDDAKEEGNYDYAISQ